MEKPKKKKLLIILGSLVGAVVLIFIIFMFSIGAIVKTGVSTVLPKITGTPCSMGMCTFNPIAGQVTMRDFVIGNPPGYAHPNAFKMGTLEIDVGMTSLFAEKIVIQKIIIENMEVDFEVKLTETNLTVIKGNVDEFSKSAAEAEEKKEEPGTEQEDAEKPGKKLQIDLFKFVNNKIIIGTAGETLDVPLADIIIEDIGDSQEGATVGEVSEKVFTALYDSVLKKVSESDVDLGGALKKGTNKIIDGVKGLFGGDKKE